MVYVLARSNDSVGQNLEPSYHSTTTKSHTTTRDRPIHDAEPCVNKVSRVNP